MPARIRQAEPADVPRILGLEEACYPNLSRVTRWTSDLLRVHQERFPEGQLLADDRDAVVGYSASFVTRSELALAPHTFREITERGTFAGHDPGGDTLYGAEIMVHPGYRRRGVGRRLYRARLDVLVRLGLRYFVAGGRIPGYGRVADEVAAAAYVADVVAGRRVDRVLTPQLRSGMKVRGVLPSYLNDASSRGWATLLVWENPRWRGGKPPEAAAPGARDQFEKPA